MLLSGFMITVCRPAGNIKAYEVLSDEESRKIYDKTGQQQTTSRGGHGFEDRHQRPPHQPWKAVHRHLFDPYLRYQIHDCQHRVISISSLEHLMAVGYDERGIYQIGLSIRILHVALNL
jgi:curved DNA-binding protein CbpA